MEALTDEEAPPLVLPPDEEEKINEKNISSPPNLYCHECIGT